MYGRTPLLCRRQPKGHAVLCSAADGGVLLWIATSIGEGTQGRQEGSAIRHEPGEGPCSGRTLWRTGPRFLGTSVLCRTEIAPCVRCPGSRVPEDGTAGQVGRESLSESGAIIPLPLVEVPSITKEELDTAPERLRGRKTAPRLDGVSGRVLFLAATHLRGQLREIYHAVERGPLCEIPKEGRCLYDPFVYRPNVLIDEVVKVFEKILTSRLARQLSEAQYYFRAGRSTIYDLNALKGLEREKRRKEGKLSWRYLWT